MSAALVADAVEAAVRDRDVSSLLPLLHPSVQATSHDRVVYRGVADVLAWAQSLFDTDATISVVERYIDEPLAILVVLRVSAAEPRGVELTAALTTLDGTLVRVTLDA